MIHTLDPLSDEGMGKKKLNAQQIHYTQIIYTKTTIQDVM